MIVCGTELELDIYDAQAAKRYDNAIAQLQQEIEQLKKKETVMGLSDQICAQCAMVENCINRIFGEGSAQKVFHGEQNLKTALKAFEEIAIGVREQRDELNQMAKSMVGHIDGQRRRGVKKK